MGRQGIGFRSLLRFTIGEIDCTGVGRPHPEPPKYDSLEYNRLTGLVKLEQDNVCMQCSMRFECARADVCVYKSEFFYK